MATGYSLLYANKINDAVFRKTDFIAAIPASYWVALFINTLAGTHLRADDYASAQEVSGGAYARVEVRGSTGITWGTSSGGLTTQTGDITFPAATGNWGTVYAVGLMDAVSAGHVVLYADLSVPKAVSTPDVFKVPSTYFQCQL